MAYISVPEGEYGIRSLVMFRPDTGRQLYALVQALLRGDSPLLQAERELIAAFVSSRNGCRFCTESHAAAARFLFKEQKDIVDYVLDDYKKAPVNGKFRALLNVAAKVQVNGKEVTFEDISDARAHGAVDREIHDTVLIAATFSLFNRYVDGLASLTPSDRAEYDEMGARMGERGYIMPGTTG